MRKKLILFAVVFFNITLTINAQIGKVSVKTWADDRKGAFAFTFDDGFISHYETARPILNSFGFKGTFYIISNVLNETLPGQWRYGSWEQFRQIAADGHEIGSHTVSHPDLTTLPVGNKFTPNTLNYEFYQSKMKIQEEIPGTNVVSIAYPYTNYNSQVQQIVEEYYENARGGGNNLNSSTLSVNQRLSIYSKTYTFNLPRNSINDDLDELNDMKQYINNAISQNKWGTYMIHEVYPFSQLAWALQQGAYYPVTSEFLTSVCQFLKEKSDNNEVWVTTVGDITKYIRERDSFSSYVVSQTESKIELNVTDDLDNLIYNLPLTVDIAVPSDWDTVTISQNGTVQIAKSFVSSSQRVVRAYVTPDKGNVTLNKKAAPVVPSTYNIAGNIVYADSLSTPLPGVTVSYNSNESVSTNNAGDFLFQNKPSGNYTLSFSESDFKAVNSTDALWVMLGFTNSIQLNAMQALAADVTNDNRINATDALMILKRYAGAITEYNKPDWIFNPSEINAELTNANQTHSIKAILAGDVNRSYKP